MPATKKFKIVEDVESLINDMTSGKKTNMKNVNSNNSKKDGELPVNIKCTQEEYSRLEKLCSNQNQPMEDYILDKALKEGGRKSRKNRKRVATIVYLQQTLNEMSAQMKKTGNKKEVASYLDILQKEADDLWQ